MRRALACSLALLSLAMQSLPAAQSATLTESVDGISTEIVLKELDLIKLNTRLKLQMMPQAWTRRRWALYGFTNATLTSIGAFENGWGRFHWLDTSKRAPRDFFEHAGWCRVIANSISVGGSTLEMANECWQSHKEHKNAVDLPTLRKYETRLTSEIDDLLHQREQQISGANLSEREAQLTNQETALLVGLREQAVSEFVQYYSDAERGAATRRLNYLISFASNLASGSGSFVGIHASQLNRIKAKTRNRMGGVGGVCDIVSGAMNITAPVVSRAGGALAAKIARHQLKIDLDLADNQLANLQQQEHRLSEEILKQRAGQADGMLERQTLISKELSVLQQHFDLLAREKKAARARFIENLANASIAGSTKVANGIGGTVGAFKYTNNARKRFEVTGAVGIAYGIGNSLSAAETLRNQFFTELNAHKSAAAGTSTRQLLSQQLDDLDNAGSNMQLAAKKITNPL